MSELREFLGDKYSPKSDRWLHQQVVWESDSARSHYLAFVREVMSNKAPGCEMLDYNCGTGWAGLLLAEYGFKPSFAVGKGKCVDFLRWRLKRRELDYKVYDLKGAPRLPLAVSLDSLLTYKDPWTAIQELATTGEVAIFDLNKRWPIIKGATFAVDVDELTARTKESFTVLVHKTYNHYAHLFAVVGTEREEEQHV